MADQRGTLDFWFKPNFNGSPGYLQYLFDYAANANTDRLSVRINPNGNLELVVWAGAALANIISIPFSATAGQWYHFRGAWEDSGGALNKAYGWLDGAAFTANQGLAVGARGANTGIIRLGNSWQYNAGFDGAIDEFAIFDDAFDEAGSWGNFTPPDSAWTAGQTAGTGGNIGTNIFLAHFDSAIEMNRGTQWADYFIGYPAMVFTNGAETIASDRIRVTTYPERTRVWTDSTGSPYTPAARIKYSEGYALGTETGWGTNFQYHHRAASANAGAPITSPVLNLRRQIKFWSDEDIGATNDSAGYNQGYGILLYNPKEIDVNHLEMAQSHYGIYISGNPYTSATTYPTQYIRKSSFYNIGPGGIGSGAQSWSIFVTGKTWGSQVFDNNSFISLGAENYAFQETSSANITLSNNYFMRAAGTYLIYLNGGRVFTLSGNKFLNEYYPVGLAAGTAKITLSDNEFWRFRRGISLNGNSFVAMSGNSFDGGVSAEATNGYYGTALYVAPASSNVEITDLNSNYGRSIWNEADIIIPEDTTTYLAGSLLRYTGDGVNLNSKFNYLGSSAQDKVGTEYVATAIPGVDVRVGNDKDIINFTNYGVMRTTGPGLNDVTVKTAGGYAWRLESTSKTDALEYTAKVVGVAGKPLVATGYLRLNSSYGSTNLPAVALSGLGMTGVNLTWTAAATANTWQQFVVSGTPTESALATLTFTVKSNPVVADSGTAENVDDGQGNLVATIIEDTDKSWAKDLWQGYKMRDDQNFVFDIIGNTANRLFLKGSRIPFGNILPTQPYGSTYEIFSPPYVYLDDISVLSGTVDTGTLDFHSSGQPVSPFLNTGLTAEAVWSAQYGLFSDINGSFGQLLNDRLAIKKGFVSDVSATAISFVTDLTETTSNFYQNQIMVMMSGQNNGLSRRISTYNGSTKAIALDLALPFSPAFNDEFIILSQYAAAPSDNGATAEEVAEAVWEYVDRRLTAASLTGAGGGALATGAEITALQADVTFIKNKVDLIYADTQYVRGIADDILAKWNSYDAEDIITNLDIAKARIGEHTDLSGANTLFGRTKYLQEKWGTQTAQAIYGKTDDAYNKIIEIQNELGYNGQSTSVYEDLQDVAGYTDQIEGYADSLETLVGLPADLSSADTLFGRIKKNYEAVLALNNITAQQVWEYGTKTLTGGVTLSNPTQVWAVATSSLSILGSIGKLVVDNLDAAVSTRGISNLTAADIWDAGTRTISNITDEGLQAIASEIWTSASRTLTSGDATAQRVWNTLLSAITTTNSIGLLLKTDIDTTVSSRASSSELNAATSTIVAEINANEAKIDSLVSNLIVAQSSVDDFAPTAAVFDANLANANDNFYNDGVLLFTSGLNSGQVRRIYDYAGATRTITVDPALTVAPANGDTFTILAQSASASLDASAIWNYAARRLTDAQLDSGSLTTLANLNAAEAVLNSNISNVQNSVDLLANDLISIRSTVNTSAISSTISSFVTNLTSIVNDLYNNALITFTSGDNAGVARRIENYDGANKTITVEPDLPSAPINNDSFTILKQIAVPTAKISAIQTDVSTVRSDVAVVKSDISTIKGDIASIKSRLDSVESNIATLQNKVNNSITNVYSVSPSDMFSELNTISVSINSINSNIGKLDPALFNSILAVSQSLSVDNKSLQSEQALTGQNVEYIKNKLADFKAVTNIQRQIVEKPASPIVNTWFTTGSVDLNVMITNPADTGQKIPIKVYLPKEAKMEHIMETDGLEIQYDVQLDTSFAIGEFLLGPGEVLKKTIKMRDIWIIPEEDASTIKNQAIALNQQLGNGQLSAQALLLKNDLEARIDKIIRTQKENTATPQDKIMTFRENKESLAVAQKNLDELKNLVIQNSASKGFLGALGGVQTITVWGIMIAFITGFGLLVIILFTMWRHQMRIAGGQLALQTHVLNDSYKEREIFKEMAGGGADRRKRMLKKKISGPLAFKANKKTYLSFYSHIINFLKKLLKKLTKIIIYTITSVILIAMVFYFKSGIIKIFSSFYQTEARNEALNKKDFQKIQPASKENNANNKIDDIIKTEIAAPAATSSILSQTPAAASTTYVVIKDTPAGWLNVRQESSKTAALIGRVKSGEIFKSIGRTKPAASEQFIWYNIILSDETVGWIYGEYAEPAAD